jgi:hypothetical protein
VSCLTLFPKPCSQLQTQQLRYVGSAVAARVRMIFNELCEAPVLRFDNFVVRRERERKRERKRDRERRERERERERKRQRDKERQRDRGTEGQRERQRDRGTEGQSETCKYSLALPRFQMYGVVSLEEGALSSFEPFLLPLRFSFSLVFSLPLFPTLRRRCLDYTRDVPPRDHKQHRQQHDVLPWPLRIRSRRGDACRSARQHESQLHGERLVSRHESVGPGRHAAVGDGRGQHHWHPQRACLGAERWPFHTRHGSKV